MKIKHILSIFLIGACIALPAFSFAQSDACHAKNPANDGNTHNYTCQAKSDKDTNRDLCRGDGSSNSWPELSCGQNTTNVCHRCVCNPPKKRENGRCVSPATKDCQSYNDQTTCLSETCEWKDNKCQNKGTAPKGCSDYKDKPTCPTSNCEWTSSNICQNKIPLEEGWSNWTENAGGNNEDPNKAFADCMAKKSKCYERIGTDSAGKCVKAGISLNTDVPFIWRCISLNNNDQMNAFPTLIGALMRILTSAMLVIGFMMILIAGVMMTTGGVSANNYKTGKEMIFKVWAALALLGSLGVILKLINPTFFT